MEKICRTCLKTPKTSILLFEHPSLISKIQIIASIKVVNRECFSKIICEECYKNVNRLFKFRKMIIDSDIKIRSFARKRIRQNKHDDSKLTTPILRQQVVKTLEKENNCTEEKPSQNEEELDEKYERISPKEGSADLSSPPKKETQIRKHICNICGKIIRTDNLSRHIQNHSENPVSCSLCGKTLKNRNSLRVHLVTLHNDASFTCDSCGKSFKYKKSLSQHMQKNHAPDSESKNVRTCPTCNKKFTCNFYLQRHMRSHTGERPYGCETCFKNFSSKYALETHMRLHTNFKPFVCHFCSETFNQKVSLQKHLKSKHETDGSS